MLDAVLFDWGDTLMQWVWDDALIDEGNRAGLAAIGRDGLPSSEQMAQYFTDRVQQLFPPDEVLEEVEYPGLVRGLFGHFGVELSDEELARFLEAEHAAWVGGALRVGATTHALLEALRDRSLKLAIVSNAFDPGWLMHRDLERTGVAERVDFAVFSSEFGLRKPHPAIFEHALEAIGVEPERALFVGDRLYNDVRGAAEVGMRTVQALWFRADEHPNGREPDFQAFTQMDVLNVVRRLEER